MKAIFEFVAMLSHIEIPHPSHTPLTKIKENTVLARPCVSRDRVFGVKSCLFEDAMFGKKIDCAQKENKL